MDHPDLKKLEGISTFIFDVDGVLTDGSLLVTEKGELLRSMNIKDGLGLKMAMEKGYHVVIISGGSSEGVRIRLNKLGVSEVHLNVKDKMGVFRSILQQKNITSQECIYMGDDLPDLEVMAECGLKACPADAVWEVQEISDIICSTNGGKGCARELIEIVLKAQNKW